MKISIERLFVIVFVLLPLLIIITTRAFFNPFSALHIFGPIYEMIIIYIKLILPIVFLVMIVHLFFSMFRFIGYKKLKNDVGKKLEKKHIIWTIIFVIILLIEFFMIDSFLFKKSPFVDPQKIAPVLVN
jgi:hypothetical protein